MDEYIRIMGTYRILSLLQGAFAPLLSTQNPAVTLDKLNEINHLHQAVTLPASSFQSFQNIDFNRNCTLKCWFFIEERNQRTQRKTPQRTDEIQQQPQPTRDVSCWNQTKTARTLTPMRSCSPSPSPLPARKCQYRHLLLHILFF